MPVFGSILKKEHDTWCVRELAGSFHRLRYSNRPVPLFIIFGLNDIPSDVVEEIALWDWVHYIDARSVLLGSLWENIESDERLLSLLFLDYLTRTYGHAILLDMELTLKREIGVDMLSTDLAKEGSLTLGLPNALLVEGYSHLQFERLHRKALSDHFFGQVSKPPLQGPTTFQDIGRYSLEPSKPKPLQSVGSGTQHFCHLSLRQILQWAPLLVAHNETVPRNPERPRVCFGMPTKNKPGLPVDECPIIKTFLRTLARAF